MENKYSDLYVYNLEYWEQGEVTRSKVNGLTVTEFDFTATAETTYLWTVIPTIGGADGVIGQCFSGEWTFSVKFGKCT